MLRYRVVREIMRAIQMALSRLDVGGLENVPDNGPYLVAINHMSTADTPLLLIAFPPIRWRYFAGEKWRDHWFYGPVMAWLGAIYIDRARIDRRGLQEALTALSAGYVFALAPEGSRSKSGGLMAAKDGAAYLASQANVPILPVGISSSDVLFANARRWRRTRLKISIGRPFTLPDLGRRARTRDLPAYTLLIMVHIASLLPPRYHGHYRSSAALTAQLAGENPWPYCQRAAAAPPDDL